MNATQRSSRYTNVPGISPAMILLKIVVMVRMYARPHGDSGAEPLPHGAERIHPVSSVLHPVVPLLVVRPRQPRRCGLVARRARRNRLGRWMAGASPAP